MSNEYVQYGCGWSAPQQWRNFDASPTLRFERLPIIGKLYTKNEARFPDNVEFGDIVSGLPVADNSCKAVYCSHILEHLSLDDFRASLANTHKILKSGGCFRLVLPDLEFSIKNYMSDTSAEAATNFLMETSLGVQKRNRGIIAFFKGMLGNSQHLWMWDYKAIEQELSNAGFVNIKRAQFGDSEDEMFKAVESEDRWINCLGVDSRKP